MEEPTSELCLSRIIHEDLVAAGREAALGNPEVEELARFFKAFADPTRLGILWALKQHEMCVCDLAALLSLSESAVSHQLRLLRTMRLVANRREGPILYYRLNDNHVGGLIDLALEHAGERNR